VRRGIRKSANFLADLDTQFRWYEQEAGWEIAWRYLLVVDQTLNRLAEHADLGRLRHFSHPELQRLRSFLVTRPFNRHLIFYRHDDANLDAVRIMHGARDLPRRLRQPPAIQNE
jgi:toxin ParE1/3/4